MPLPPGPSPEGRGGPDAPTPKGSGEPEQRRERVPHPRPAPARRGEPEHHQCDTRARLPSLAGWGTVPGLKARANPTRHVRRRADAAVTDPFALAAMEREGLALPLQGRDHPPRRRPLAPLSAPERGWG